MVLSPAKALDFAPAPLALPATAPQLAAETARLARVARGLSAADLRRLMKLSDALADLNVARFQAFDARGGEGLQAVFAFNGDVYRGMGARRLDAAALAWAQDHVRILSGLYGVLRPLDAIQPHRLEMGSRLRTDRGDSLYAFWGARPARALDRALEGHADPTLVNLASQEYFGAVDRSVLKAPLVTCHFRQRRGDDVRTLSFHAKRARGLMTRWAVDRRAERADDLKGFDAEGYAFQPHASAARDWVFIRDAVPAEDEP